MAASRGPRHAGAKTIGAVAPLANKREKAGEMGATHSPATAEEAQRLVMEQLVPGVGADSSIITVNIVDENVVNAGFDVIRKGGRGVITGLADPAKKTVHGSGGLMTLFQKSIHGLLFDGCNPIYNI